MDKLTLKEKASLLVGYKNMSTLPIESKGIKPIIMSDGPYGIRKELDDGNSLDNVGKSLPSTCFPVSIALSSTWNDDLAYNMGNAIGDECIYYNIDLLLGPAVNILRNPLCGRNFEYFSEDPLLSGKIGSFFVRGLDNKNIGACIKHFAANNNERYRYIGDSIVDNRALNEIYLKPFEIIINESNPKAIMTAYNKLNGDFCSENRWLLKDILRDKWKFNGLTMTDWGGIKDRVTALKNGLDLEMPGMQEYSIKRIYDSVKDKTTDIKTVDESINRLFKLKESVGSKTKIDIDFKKHYNLALDIAIEGAVLLKNKDDILPLDINKKYLVVGGLFKNARYQGSGSSMLNPMIFKDHINAFKENNIKYDFAYGYNEFSDIVDEKLEEEAIKLSNNYDEILFFGGLNDYYESEGFDRETMEIPYNQVHLIKRLKELNKKIILVLFSGSPVDLSFIDSLDAVLDMMLPGEAIGDATLNLLFGKSSPSGKLTQTWPIKYEDIPESKNYTSSPIELYKESIFVGYRYFSTIKKKVLFPFGYGLSYSNFEYSNLRIDKNNEIINISFDIKNVGRYKAKEITQAYVSKSDSLVVRPNIELKGYKKVELDINETKNVSINIPIEYLKIYSNNEFVLENGEYIFSIGKSSNDLVLTGKLNITGEVLKPYLYDEIYKKYLKTCVLSNEDYEKILNKKIPVYEYNKKPYTMETPICEFNTFFGKIIKKAVSSVGLKKMKKTDKMPQGFDKEREKKAGYFIYKLMPYNSLRSLSYSSAGILKYNVACGMLDISNGHIFKGLFKIIKKYKIKEK